MIVQEDKAMQNKKKLEIMEMKSVVLVQILSQYLVLILTFRILRIYVVGSSQSNFILLY